MTTPGEPTHPPVDPPHADPHRLDEQLIGKVRKLLAMAEGTDNANEADAFSRKAAELIAAHRLDPERLREHRDDQLAVRRFPLGRGAYVRARLALLQAVAEAHDCTVVFQHLPHGTEAMVAGFRADLDTTEVLHASLHAQAAARMARETRATGAATQRWRRSFLFGYADQVRRMLARSNDDAARRADPTGSMLPARRERAARIREFARAEFGTVVAARRPSPATASGWQAGQRAAERADIGRAAVPGRRALGRGA